MPLTKLQKTSFSDATVDTMKPRQHSRHFRDILKRIFLIENVWISLNFGSGVPFNNILTLFNTMACRQPGDKPSSETDCPVYSRFYTSLGLGESNIRKDNIATGLSIITSHSMFQNIVIVPHPIPYLWCDVSKPTHKVKLFTSSLDKLMTLHLSNINIIAFRYPVWCQTDDTMINMQWAQNFTATIYYRSRKSSLEHLLFTLTVPFGMISWQK